MPEHHIRMNDKTGLVPAGLLSDHPPLRTPFQAYSDRLAARAHQAMIDARIAAANARRSA